MSDLLSLNGMLYQPRDDVGIATSKNVYVSPSRVKTYSTISAPMVFDISMPNKWVSGHESFLLFEFEADDVNATWGKGSALNMIHEVIILSKDNTEVTRSVKANLHGFVRDAWTKPADWYNTVGQVSGYGSISASRVVTPTQASVKYQYCIPMSSLSGLFNRPELIPPYLLDGCHIHISIEKLTIGTTGVYNQIGAFAISNPAIHWSYVELTPAYQSALDNMAMTTGITYMFNDYHHQTVNDVKGETRYEIDVTRSITKAVDVFVVSRTKPASEQKEYETDSFLSEEFAYTHSQFMIGNEYMPTIAVTGSGADTQAGLFYQYALLGNDKLKYSPVNTPRVSLTDFTDFDLTNPGGYGQLCVNFNKSFISKYDGYRVNEQLPLRISIGYTSASVNRYIDLFVTYVKQLRILGKSVTVLV